MRVLWSPMASARWWLILSTESKIADYTDDDVRLSLP